MIDLTPTLLTKYQDKKKEINRFSVSDCWAIIHGRITPKDYLRGEIRDFSQIFKMWQGTWKHNQIQELLKELGYEIEPKIEYKTDDFVLVGKADAILGDEILEIKTSAELIPNAKSWHIEQVMIYLSLFKKQKGVIVQPITKGNKLFLKEIGKVERDDEFFRKVLEELKEFQSKLK